VATPAQELNGGRSRIVENTAALSVAGAAQLVFTLVQLGILSRYLDTGGFGVFVALKGFALLLSALLLAGTPQVLLRFLPSLQSRGRSGRAVGLFALFSAGVFGLAVIALLTARWWTGALPAEIRAAAGPHVIRLLVAASVALALRQLLFGGFSGLREMRLQMVFELAYQVLLTAYMVVWRSRLDVPGLLAAIAALGIVSWAAGIPVYLRFVRTGRAAAGPPAGAAVVIPSLTAYWGSAVVLSLSALAFTDVDRFVMTSLVPLTMIPVYHIASRINQLIKRFLGFPVVAMQPEVTRIYEQGRWHDLERRISLFTKATVVASLAASAVAAAVGREAIVLVSGEQFAGAYPILLALILTVPIAAYVAPLGATMRALHFMWWAVMCDLSWMAVYFAGMFLFIPRVGLVGAAAAQIVAYLFYTAVSVEFARRRRFLGRRGLPAMLRALVVCAVAGGAGAAACAAWGLPAAAACIVLMPLALREALRRAEVFEPDEAEAIASMIPAGPARRVVRWSLSCAEGGR